MTQTPPTDLEDWSPENVLMWIKWASQHFQLVDSIFNSITGVSGKEVAQWKHEDVKFISPNDTDNLFWTHLQILKKCKLAGMCCVFYGMYDG